LARVRMLAAIIRLRIEGLPVPVRRQRRACVAVPIVSSTRSIKSLF